MNKRGSTTAIAAMILLISFLLVSVIAASVITTGSENTTSDEEMEEILNDVLDEITTYIQIKDKIGKYYTTDGTTKIEKIAILVKPLISTNIDVTQLNIKLCDGNTIKILSYSEKAVFIESKPLFEHPIWDEIDKDNFGFITLLDEDRSLIDHNILNKDMTYIVIKIPDEFSLTKKETITITLFPESGIQITMELKAPPPIKPVVSFE
jgi:archaellin